MNRRHSSSIARAAAHLADVRAIAEAAVTTWPQGGADRTAARGLIAQYATPGALAPVLESVYRDGWKAGEVAALDATARAQNAAKADDGDELNWDDLDDADVYDADNLENLIRTQVGSLASIEDHRLDQLAHVLADALSGPAPGVDDLADRLHGVLDDPRWADLVASTEMNRAMTAASLSTYARNGIPGKAFLTAEDQRVCQMCSENEDAGAIPLSASFPNDDPPVHPDCRCAVMPDWLDSYAAAAEDISPEDLDE